MKIRDFKILMVVLLAGISSYTHAGSEKFRLFPNGTFFELQIQNADKFYRPVQRKALLDLLRDPNPNSVKLRTRNDLELFLSTHFAGSNLSKLEATLSASKSEKVSRAMLEKSQKVEDSKGAVSDVVDQAHEVASKLAEMGPPSPGCHSSPNIDDFPKTWTSVADTRTQPILQCLEKIPGFPVGKVEDLRKNHSGQIDIGFGRNEVAAKEGAKVLGIQESKGPSGGFSLTESIEKLCQLHSAITAPVGLLPLALIEMANKNYYSIPYEKDPSDIARSMVAGKLIAIPRPAHGLAHAVRKVALTQDLLNTLLDLSESMSYMGQWIRIEGKLNPMLGKQLEFAALMMRTGRTWESNDDYKNQCDRSALFFTKEAKGTHLFQNDQQITDIALALHAMGDGDVLNRLNRHQRAIYSFLYAVHHFDLRRIPGHSPAKHIDLIKGFLGGPPNNTPVSAETIRRLYAKSGQYLKASGDWDIVKGEVSRTDAFFTLSANPKDLLRKIEEVQKKPLPTFEDAKNELSLGD